MLSDDSAGDIVSPQKNFQQVMKESNEGKELYKRSHNDYDVGTYICTYVRAY